MCCRELVRGVESGSFFARSGGVCFFNTFSSILSEEKCQCQTVSEEKDFVRIAHFGRIFIWVDFFVLIVFAGFVVCDRLQEPEVATDQNSSVVARGTRKRITHRGGGWAEVRRRK